MANFDGDLDEFLEDRLKRCKTARFGNAGAQPQPKTGKNRSSILNRKLVWLAVSYLVVIGLMFGSFGTAYAAKDSLPNEPLYAVKLAGEDLQLLLTSDTNARISLLTTFANRRADEATILASQGEPVPEQVTTLIVEYQDEIAALSASTIVPDPRQPRDRDNGGDEEDEDPPERNLAGEGEQEEDPEGEQQRNGDAAELSIDQTTTTTADPIIVDLTTTKTGTNRNSGKMNTTQIGSGPSNSSGQENRQDYSSGSEYEYVPSVLIPSSNYRPEPNYALGNSSVVPQQPPTTNPLMGSGSSNQPTENKGNKP